MTDLKSDDIIERVGGLIAEIDPECEPGSLEWQAAAVLITSSWLGQDEEMLAKVLGTEPAFIRTIARRFRANEIWTDEGVDLGVEEDGTEFWLKVVVGMGQLRRKWRQGQWRYSAMPTLN